ncbi:hypothetical protein B0H11DRAFT_624904 [Mycena galericulata]|nr:hypothetical protein B0H11DRAFT_624904 [Mycena galericulata]
MVPSINLPVVINGILLSFCHAIYAEFIPPTTTMTAPCSIVYPGDNWLSTPSSRENTNLAVRQTTAPPGEPPPLQSDTSPRTTFTTVVDNPLIIASIIIAVIALTILVALFCHILRRRRIWRNQPPPPDTYLTRSDSLSITRVLISPLSIAGSGPPVLPPIPPVIFSRMPSPAPTLTILPRARTPSPLPRITPTALPDAPAPRITIVPRLRKQSLAPTITTTLPLHAPARPPSPSPIRTISSLSYLSEPPSPSDAHSVSSSDIHQVMRELRGLSLGFAPGSGAAHDYRASRSSLGTMRTPTHTRPPSIATVMRPLPVPPLAVYAAVRSPDNDRRRRYGVLYDVEAGIRRWQ